MRIIAIFLLLMGQLFAQNPLFVPDTLSGEQITLTLQNGQTSFYSQPSSTMGANGAVLGPTLLLNKGDSVYLTVQNNLGEVTTIHWHGLHVAPENDGGPHAEIAPGTSILNKFEVLDHAATYWYHPHLHMHTNEHVSKGLAGMILVRDVEEAALALPRSYGIDDFPLILQSRDFDLNKEVLVGTAMDTALMVNATLNPYLDAPAQLVRFRLLNGSAERVYNLGFSDDRNFSVIASDGGLLNNPVSLNRVMLSPGERMEILVDLQNDFGQTLFLMSYSSELSNGIYGATQPGMGMGQTIPNYSSNPLNGADFNLLQLNVGAATPNPIFTVPTALVNDLPLQESNANAQRSLTFTPQVMGPTAIEGPFFINGSTFDMGVINYTIPLGNTEVWTLQNNTPIAHPFHIHDVQFYILDINGQAPPAHLQGRKDVVMVPAGMGTVRFIAKFEDFANDSIPYMYHCHMLTHEDDGMMGQFLVVDSSTTSNFINYEHSGWATTISPNPCTDYLQLHMENSQPQAAVLTVFDYLGREIIIENIDSGTLDIELNSSAWKQGLYYYCIRSSNCIVAAGSFVKQ